MGKLFTYILLIIAVLGVQLSTKAGEFHGQMHAMASSTTAETHDSAQPCTMMKEAAMPAMADNSDCCGADCSCPPSACSALNFIGVYTLTVVDILQNERIILSGAPTPATSVSNPFRPPIIS